MDTKVITGKVRFSYVTVFEPKAMQEGAKPKYSVCLLIPKTDEKTIKAVKAAIDTAYESGQAIFGGKLPKVWKNPLRDGDEERDDNPAFEDMYFINANSLNQPGVINKARKELTKDEFYSGCYGRASINFYPFNNSGNKGVACGLNNLLKESDGEKLSGTKVEARDDFADFTEADDFLD